MQELTQKSGKNYVNISFSEDGLVYKRLINGDESSRTLPFSKLGPLSNDYANQTQRELRFSNTIRRIIFFTTFLTAILCFVIATKLEKTGSVETKASTLFIVFGWLTVLFGLCCAMVQVRRVKQKKVYFSSGGFVTLYARNQQDLDQINSFSLMYKKAELQSLKIWFVAQLETQPDKLEDTLHYLHEQDQFSEKEYKQYIKIITDAQKH